MSKISPSGISGTFVRGVSGTIWVCPGPGRGAVVVPCWEVWAEAVPSLTVKVTVRVPGVAYLRDAVTPELVGEPSPQFHVYVSGSPSRSNEFDAFASQVKVTQFIEKAATGVRLPVS